MTGNIVWGYLYPFLWDVVHAVGGSDWDVDSVYYFFVDLLSGFWGGIVSAALFGPIALWLLVKNSIQWVYNVFSWSRWFVENVVAPGWGWLTSTVWWLVSVAQNLGGQIWAIASQVVTNALGAVWNWIGWLRSQIDALKHYLESKIADAVSWLSTQLQQLQQFVAGLQGQIETWVQGFVNGLIGELLKHVQPLFDFLTWWQNVGSHALVAFVNDPAKFILDMIADAFLPWLADLVAKNW